MFVGCITDFSHTALRKAFWLSVDLFSFCIWEETCGSFNISGNNLTDVSLKWQFSFQQSSENMSNWTQKAESST